jgi:hypothetical protein
MVGTKETSVNKSHATFENTRYFVVQELDNVYTKNILGTAWT